MQAVKIDTGFRVLNRQYDRRNNLKVNLFVLRELSVGNWNIPSQQKELKNDGKKGCAGVRNSDKSST